MFSSVKEKISLVILIVSLIPDMVLGYLKDLSHFLTPSFLRRKKTISGQTVLVTGAGNGLGRQMAIEFSKHSVCLVMLDSNRSALIHTEKLLDPSSRTFIYECDVSNRNRVYHVAKIVKEEVGKVDILVNNADIVSGKGLFEIPDEKIEKTIQVNALAHFWMCKAFLPDMLSSNNGHIVSIASLAGLSGLPNLTDYCASKFAAVGFMEALKLELDSQNKDGIKLTLVCPSLISTGLFEGTKPPLTVLMTPEYVAGEIVKAVLEEKDFVMLPRWMYIIILLKWTMPRRAVDKFYTNSGLLDFMDTFRGRASNSNGNPIQTTA